MEIWRLVSPRRHGYTEIHGGKCLHFSVDGVSTSRRQSIDVVGRDARQRRDVDAGLRGSLLKNLRSGTRAS